MPGFNKPSCPISISAQCLDWKESRWIQLTLNLYFYILMFDHHENDPLLPDHQSIQIATEACGWYNYKEMKLKDSNRHVIVCHMNEKHCSSRLPWEQATYTNTTIHQNIGIVCEAHKKVANTMLECSNPTLSLISCVTLKNLLNLPDLPCLHW